jgi:hypothetical protein
MLTFWKKIDMGTEEKKRGRELMMNVRQEKKDSREFSHTLFLPYIHLCVCVFSFFVCSMRTSCMFAITVKRK